jgi:acetoin utilization protein AcuB
MNVGRRVGNNSWIRVVDVMIESPLTVTPSQTAGDAQQLMLERGFRQLPVVEGRKLVGIVSDRDMRSCLGGQFGVDPEARETALKTPVGALMNRELITLCPHDSLQKALETLIDAKVGGIPVVDQAAGLLGIVTYIDLLRCFLNRIEEE